MGFLYREVIANKRTSASKAMAFIVLLTLAAYTSANSVNYSNRYDIWLGLILFIDAVLLALVLRIAYEIVYLSRLRYKYMLIDKELIFEKIVGNSRKVVLSINTKDIEAIKGISEGRKYKNIDRTYKFLCSPCRSKIYCCIVNHDGKKIRSYFQPSEELLKKLTSLMRVEPN